MHSVHCRESEPVQGWLLSMSRCESFWLSWVIHRETRLAEKVARNLASPFETSQIALLSDELRSWEWCDRKTVKTRVPDFMFRRLDAALEAEVVAKHARAGKMRFMTQDDRQVMRDYYDELGHAEWERFESGIAGRVSLEVHRRFLARFIGTGERVLEIGAGPGRFTLELVGLGSRVVVTDFSPVQLELNRTRLAGVALVESWQLLDVCDTTAYSDGEFDAVVAYGGPLSYAFEHVEEALTGLFRITRPGGVVVASVMSLLGAWRHFLAGTVADAETVGEDANDAVLHTGDLRYAGNRHICQMFRSREIIDLVERCGGELLAISASNWASLDDPEALARLEADPDRWRRFLDHEVAACEEPGALDGGTHILFAATSGSRVKEGTAYVARPTTF